MRTRRAYVAVLPRVSNIGLAALRRCGECVDRDSYDDPSSGLDLFEQCLIDGQVSSIHWVARESIGSRRISRAIVADHAAIIASLAEHGAYALGRGNWFVVGTTRNGNPFVPIWPDPPLARWRTKWPRQAVKHFARGDLIDFLDGIDAAERYCGLGRGEAIVTFHAADLADRLRGSRRRKISGGTARS